MQNNKQKLRTNKIETKKKTSSAGKTKMLQQKEDVIGKAPLWDAGIFLGFLTWIKKNIIHFAYWWNGIIIFLLVLIVYKGVLLTSLGLLDVRGFINVLRRFIEWLGNDLLYFFLVCFFVLLGMRVKQKAIKFFFVFIACVLLILFVADIFSLKNFYSRFLIWVFSFFTRENSSPYIWEWLRAFVLFRFGLWLCVYISSWVLAKKFFSEKILIIIFRLIVVIFGGIIGVSFFLGKTSSYQQNVLQIQYRDSHWESLKNQKPYEEYFVSFSWKNEKPNIIVIFAESFSSIDSLAMWGDRWLLTWFDTIAKDGTVYTNFVANGCTSDSAHIALLQWVEPWETNQLTQNYSRYKSYNLWLPAFMHQNSYNTTFLSTASLGFLDQKDFLISLQFDTIIGNEAFKKFKKYSFNAAPDEALYQKTQQVLEKNRATWDPQFIVLQTISSHKPYNSPEGNTEEQAFAYSDKQLLQFYRYLQKTNYFENGILIVMGDHRKMQSMSYEEIQKRWNGAYGKSVFAVVGKNIPKGEINTAPIQHLDVFYSLKRLVSPTNVILHQNYNDAFNDYRGRENAIRYCQYVDRQYIGTRADNSTRVILPSQDNKESSYVRSYYAFQWDRAVDWNSSLWKTSNSTSSSFSINMIQSWNDSSLSINNESKEIQDLFPNIVRIAHQWYHKTSPINSLASFLAAENQWAESIEMDITFTKDGYPVVAHGPDIGRIKCVWSSSVGKKNITDFTLQEMQDNCKLYNDQPILTLQEVLAKTKDMFPRYFIDIKIYNSKEIDFVQPMLEAIKKMWLGENVIFSSIEKSVNEQLAQDEKILAWWEITDAQYLSEILETTQKYILLPYESVTKDVVKKIKKVDKILVVYKLQDKAIMKKLYDWWVRYFMSDDVDELVR